MLQGLPEEEIRQLTEEPARGGRGRAIWLSGLAHGGVLVLGEFQTDGGTFDTFSEVDAFAPAGAV